MTQTKFILNQPMYTQTLNLEATEIEPIENTWQSTSMIPTLKNGLDVILKHPGIYPTETINKYTEGRCGSFFTKLPQYSQINKATISPYFPPGRDTKLIDMAKEGKCKYIMSTSTISSFLSHIYYAASNFKSPHFYNLSEIYDREPLKFMVSQRKPNTVYLT